MKTLGFTLIIVVILAFACKQSISPSADQATISGKALTPVITNPEPPDVPHMDTTHLSIDSMANIKLNNVLLEKKPNALYNGLYDTWLQAYSEVHHLPAALRISYTGTVMMGARGDIMDAVVKAQDNMKDYIVRDTYKKPFAKLDAAQQQALQQQHAILFQKDFH